MSLLSGCIFLDEKNVWLTLGSGAGYLRSLEVKMREESSEEEIIGSFWGNFYLSVC
jgi:hypothetical protein